MTCNMILLNIIISSALVQLALADNYATRPENEEACFDLEDDMVEVQNALSHGREKMDSLFYGETLGAGYLHCKTSACFDEGLRNFKREKKRLELKVAPGVEQLSARHKKLGCTFDGPSRLRSALNLDGFFFVNVFISQLQEKCEKAGEC